MQRRLLLTLEAASPAQRSGPSLQRSALLLVFTTAHVTALLSNFVAITVRAMDGDRWKPPLAVMCLDEASHRSCLALFRQVSRASLPVACVEPAVASALFNGAAIRCLLRVPLGLSVIIVSGRWMRERAERWQPQPPAAPGCGLLRE